MKAGAKPINVHAYLSFDGNCKEAFAFYARCFGGNVESSFPYGDSPMADQVGPEAKDRIMHARLCIGDSMFMGSDAFPGRYEAPKGNWVALGMQDAADADRIFAELAEGGNVVMPIQQTFWAQRFAMVVDRYGIPWMINCE